ncbi:MAG: C2 family cysteine protease [Archangium sp.]|nr:C2 family cysteine protease [Archangium sp.]
MPTKIGDSIARALRDNTVSIREVKTLITEAKAQPLTAETKAELQTLLTQHGDKFGSTAKRDLQKFLGTATITQPPAPPAPATPRAIDDPTVLTKHTTDTTWKPVQDGKLFVDGVSYDDVVQGSIANCYMVGAFSAVAQANPDTIKNAIKENADGTFTVRFYEKDYSGSMKPVDVTVDGDLPQSSLGSARYGKARDGKELWVGVLEKAYAQWKGGYETIGNGGYPGEVIAALTGKSTTYSSNKYTDANTLFTNIQKGAANHKAMTSPTHGKDSGVDYSGTGVYAWHVYTVLGAVDEGGTKYVQLRNPWGSTEPGSDGKNDGIFKMKLDDFTKLYQGVDIGN